MNKITAYLILTCSLYSSTLLADDIDLDIYQAAQPIKRSPARYPEDMAKNSREGWVDLYFMVSSSGEPYEIEVTSTSHGGEGFIENAINSVANYEYSPALIGDKKVDSSSEIRLRFAMEDPSNQPSNQFLFWHREFKSALEKKIRIKLKQV